MNTCATCRHSTALDHGFLACALADTPAFRATWLNVASRCRFEPSRWMAKA